MDGVPEQLCGDTKHQLEAGPALEPGLQLDPSLRPMQSLPCLWGTEKAQRLCPPGLMPSQPQRLAWLGPGSREGAAPLPAPPEPQGAQVGDRTVEFVPCALNYSTWAPEAQFPPL